MGLNFRGVQFKMFSFNFFPPERASSFAFICLFFALLCEESNILLVLQGSLKQAFLEQWRLSVFVLFSFPPLKFGKRLLNRGY